MTQKVKIGVSVPVNSAEKIRQVFGEAGAGILGEYSFCSFSVMGKGRFLPSENAAPYTGQAGKLETVDEERIEVICDKSRAREVVAKMKEAHPYEEVAFDIVPLLSEEEL